MPTGVQTLEMPFVWNETKGEVDIRRHGVDFMLAEAFDMEMARCLTCATTSRESGHTTISVTDQLNHTVPAYVTKGGICGSPAEQRR